MSDRVANLEKAVSELDPTELKQFANWLMDFDQTIWEREIAADSAAGRLDFLIDEARVEKKAGKLRDL